MKNILVFKRRTGHSVYTVCVLCISYTHKEFLLLFLPSPPPFLSQPSFSSPSHRVKRVEHQLSATWNIRIKDLCTIRFEHIDSWAKNSAIQFQTSSPTPSSGCALRADWVWRSLEHRQGFSWNAYWAILIFFLHLDLYFQRTAWLAGLP